MPSFLGSVLLLFGGAFSAYATTQALTSGSLAITPIQIGSFLNGNVLSGQENVGKALGFGMVDRHRGGHGLLRDPAAEGVEVVAVVRRCGAGAGTRTRSARPGARPHDRGAAGSSSCCSGRTSSSRSTPGILFAVTPERRCFSLDAFTGLVSAVGFTDAFGLSLSLALVTTVITLALMVPTAIYVHLRLPAVKRLFEGITILPIVIPPVVLIVGVLDVAPGIAEGHPRTCWRWSTRCSRCRSRTVRWTRAWGRCRSRHSWRRPSRSAGAGSPRCSGCCWPNLRSALLSATILTVALVLGEYTMATLDQYETFPVWIVVFSQDDAHVSVAASVASLLVTWLLLILISLIDRRRGRSAPGES